MAAEITNVSPVGDLYVPALEVDVPAGGTVAVADPALAAALLAQAGTWAPANDEAKAIVVEAAEEAEAAMAAAETTQEA